MRNLPQTPGWQNNMAKKRRRRTTAAGSVARSQRLRFRPFLEALEDRWLPSGGLPSLWSPLLLHVTSYGVSAVGLVNVNAPVDAHGTTVRAVENTPFIG